MMKKIETKNILISSDGKRYHHPGKPTLAKLLKYSGPDLTFYFNYKTKYNSFRDNDSLRSTYRYKTVFPEAEGEDGTTIEL